MKNSKAILLSCALALLAVLFNYSYLHKRERALADVNTPVKVVVAARDLPAGTRLEAGMLQLAELPKKYLQPGAMDSTDGMLGKTLTMPVLQNTQVLEPMLSYEEKVGLAAKIPKDMVAFTIAANDVTAVAGLIHPGDSVDVLVSAEVGDFKDGEPVNKQMITKLVLESVRVLAVNQHSRRSAFQAGARPVSSSPGNLFQDSTGPAMREVVVTTVTLAVTPEQCLKLTMGQEVGSLSLALRSTWSDSGIWKKDSLNSDGFLGVKKSVLRRSPPAWVEIRGAEQFNRY